MFDLIIRHAKIVDGTGNPWFYGDVAINGGTIAEVGLLQDAKANQEIDATGKVLCPGFVDGHTHSGLYVLAHPDAPMKILQGCTTENVGLDGMSVAPIKEEDKQGWRTQLSGLDGKYDVPWTWNSVSEYLDTVDKTKTAVNIGTYAGLGTIRLHAMGMAGGEPSKAQMDHMKGLVAEAMEQGARGLSAGLIYPPSQFQSLDEMVELCKVAARYDGVYDVHMRNESDTMDKAIDEVVELARRSGIRLMITHFKIRGKRNWGRAKELLAKVDAARAEGIDATVAQYPYTAGSTFLHVVVPPWYQQGGVPALLDSLENHVDDIRRDIKERNDWENFADLVGWDHIKISSVATEANKDCEGKSISEICAMRGDKDEVETVCHLLVEEKLSVGMINFGLSDDDVRVIMAHPTTSIITDGLLSGSRPHPRALATYPRVLGHYCRDEKVLSLEEAVRKMTSLPADKIRLRTKGYVRKGFDADLVVFDEATIGERNSYENPLVHPAGIEYVLVAGQVAVKQGKLTGVHAGRAIR